MSTQRFDGGIAGGLLGVATPTWAIDAQGNAQFSTISVAGGGTTGIILDNNEFISGKTTTNAVKRLIGVNASNAVSIDPDAAGVVMAGTLAVTGATSITAGLTIGSGSAGTTAYLNYGNSVTTLWASPPYDTTLGVSGFYLVHFASQFDAGRKDEVLCLGYNVTDTGRRTTSDGAIFDQWEGCYLSSGQDYLERHVIAYDAAGNSYRPLYGQFNKSNLADWRWWFQVPEFAFWDPASGTLGGTGKEYFYGSTNQINFNFKSIDTSAYDLATFRLYSTSTPEVFIDAQTANVGLVFQDWLQASFFNKVRIINATGNVGVGTATFGSNATNTLALFTGVAPTTAPADTVQVFSSDVAAGSCVVSIFQEFAPYAGVAVASTTKIPVKVNGTTYYVLATTVA